MLATFSYKQMIFGIHTLKQMNYNACNIWLYLNHYRSASEHTLLLGLDKIDCLVVYFRSG